MFPIFWPIVVFSVFILAVIGVAIGTMTGLFMSMAMSNERQGVWKNAALGVVGVLAGFMLPLLFIGRHYHAEYHIENGKPVATTSLDNLHPWLFAVLGAVLLPIIREAYRRIRGSLPSEPAPPSN